MFEVSSNGISRIDKGAKADSLRQVASGIQSGIIGTTKTGKLAAVAENVISHQPHKFHGD